MDVFKWIDSPEIKKGNRGGLVFQAADNKALIIRHRGIDDFPLTVSAMFRCRGNFWGNALEWRRRGLTDLIKPAALRTVDTFITAKTGAWVMDFYFNGDPTQLMQRIDLCATGQIYVTNKDWQQHFLEFKELETKLATEARKRFLAVTGGVLV